MPIAESRGRARSRAEGSEVEVRYEFRRGGPFKAQVRDLHDAGCGIVLQEPLEIAASVILSGVLGRQTTAVRQITGQVMWCRLCGAREYRAGIKFVDEPPPDKPPIQPTAAQNFYEILEISPNASADVLDSAYRALQRRYSALEDRSRLSLVSLAREILSDPVRKAQHDEQLRVAPHEAAQGVRISSEQVTAERDQRSRVLEILYAKRAADPKQSGLTLGEIELAVHQTNGELEFTVWYLQESGLIAPSDHGHSRYSISAAGAASLEAHLLGNNS